jgi:hypothetical protein
MKPVHLTLAAGAVVAVVLAFGVVAPAQAQKAGAQANTPSSWPWEMRNGRRVPRANRVTNADGSWREEVRVGNCVTVKTMSAAGEYRETRECE